MTVSVATSLRWYGRRFHWSRNVNGSAIEGGTSRVVAKGDFIVVPQGVPHWFNAIDGVLVLMTLHVPRVAQ